MKLILTFILTGIFGSMAYSQAGIPEEMNTILTKNMCNACHKLDEKFVGPSYKDLAAKGNNAKQIAKLIVEPQPSNWPDYPPMTAMPHLDKDEVKEMAEWIESLGIRD